MNPSPQFSVPRTGHHNEKFELARTFCWKHKRNKRMRVSIGAPWKRSSMLAMSQLGHYVNRRNVQAAVFPGLALFFSAGGTASDIQMSCVRIARRSRKTVHN